MTADPVTATRTAVVPATANASLVHPSAVSEPAIRPPAARLHEGEEVEARREATEVVGRRQLGKIAALEREHGDLIPLYRGLKRLFDPNGIMNPGKVLRAGRLRPADATQAAGRQLM